MKKIILSIVGIALLAGASGARTPSWLLFSGNTEAMAMGDVSITAPMLASRQFSLDASYIRIASSGEANNEFAASTFFAAGRKAGVNLMLRGSKDLMAGGGLTFVFGDVLYADATVKYMKLSDYDGGSGKVFCADVGLSYNEGGFTAGLKASNIGKHLPSNVKAGLSYSFNATLTHRFVLAADAGFYIPQAFRAVTASGGVEYSYNGWFFARGGYHYSSAPEAIPSFAGAGVGVRIRGIGVNATYVFAPQKGPIKNAIFCGLSFDI